MLLEHGNLALQPASVSTTNVMLIGNIPFPLPPVCYSGPGQRLFGMFLLPLLPSTIPDQRIRVLSDVQASLGQGSRHCGKRKGESMIVGQGFVKLGHWEYHL